MEASNLQPHPSVETQNFDAKGKTASSYTIEHQNLFRKQLPFKDEHDFDKSPKGVKAAPPCKQIMVEAGHVAWDISSYDFLLKGFDSLFDTIHPSL